MASVGDHEPAPPQHRTLRRRAYVASVALAVLVTAGVSIPYDGAHAS